jgi:hypothetical protein
MCARTPRAYHWTLDCTTSDSQAWIGAAHSAHVHQLAITGTARICIAWRRSTVTAATAAAAALVVIAHIAKTFWFIEWQVELKLPLKCIENY